MTWNPNSWRQFPALQQPPYVDMGAVAQAEKRLAAMPPLVFAGEARSLKASLARVAAGEAFLLQAGDCAESFDNCTAQSIRERLRVVLQMALVLTYSGGMPVVKVGRIAGQYAKPRSSDFERQGEESLPSFRGHIVNDVPFDADARRADPERLVAAYQHAAATLNLLRAFTKGGFAELARLHQWNVEFVRSSPAGERYEQMAGEIDRALQFMKACGLDSATVPALHEVDFYTSHEALILGYEEALTRTDSLTGDPYDCSAHMLWIGERTRDLDGAHVEFFSGIQNPIGCKIGPNTDPEYLLALCDRLNPEREPGRLTLITRMGAERIASALPPLLEVVRDAEHPVVWACDPMHGNTFTSASGHKTRHFDSVMAEIVGFFEAHKSAGTWPGGVHLELTSDDVTECMGGTHDVSDADLGLRYETMCDPRLNGAQALDLAFRVAELLQR